MSLCSRYPKHELVTLIYQLALLRSRPVTRSFLSLKALVVTGVLAVVACGPRLKPVEYEEPKMSGTGAPDDSEPSTSSKKAKPSTGDSDKSSGSGSGESSSAAAGGPYKPCDEKANACGTPCTECAPGDQDCMEVLISKQCNSAHKCVAAPVDCTRSKADKKDVKKGSQDTHPAAP